MAPSFPWPELQATGLEPSCPWEAQPKTLSCSLVAGGEGSPADVLVYLLKTLLVPGLGLAVNAIGGYLPPIGDILANLLGIAVPLGILAIGLGCKANFVLLQGREDNSVRVCACVCMRA